MLIPTDANSLAIMRVVLGTPRDAVDDLTANHLCLEPGRDGAEGSGMSQEEQRGACERFMHGVDGDGRRRHPEFPEPVVVRRRHHPFLSLAK